MYDYIIHSFPYCFISINPIKSMSVPFLRSPLCKRDLKKGTDIDFNQDEEYNKDEI